jgi:GT2 family glycosyltransferase
MTPPTVSVIVVSWETRDLTLDCLNAVPAAVNDECSYEIIVVDNSSRDGSAEAVAARDDARVVRNAENRGFAAAVNQAYAMAGGEMILLLNSDAQMTPGSLRTLVRFLRERPQAAGVAPLYLNPDGSRQEHYHRLPTLASLVATATALRRLGPFRRRLRIQTMADENFSRPRVVEQPSASCLLLRTSLMPRGRLLDERHPIFFNDVMLARWLADRGHRLWMTPQAVVVHELGASTGGLGPCIARHHLAGLVGYAARALPRPQAAALRAVIAADWVARRVLARGELLPARDVIKALMGRGGPLPGGRAGAVPGLHCSSAHETRSRSPSVG